MQTLLLLRAALVSRWWVVCLVFVVVTAATTAGVYLRKPVFESRAAVMVNVERLGVSVSRAEVRQDVAVLQAVEAVTSQAEVVRSKDLIERVLDTLDPAIFKGPAPRNPWVAKIVAGIDHVKAVTTDLLRELRLLPPANERYERIKRIEDNLSVSTVRQAQVIRIGFKAHDPNVARLVLQQLLNLYGGRAAENALEAEGVSMLLRQTAKVRSELDEAERELFALRTRYGITDLGAERSAMIERVNRLSATIEGTADGTGSSGAGSTRASAATRGGGDAPAGEPASRAVNTQVAQLRSQLNALRVTRAGMVADLSTEHPRLRAIDQEMAIIGALLRKELADLNDAIAGYRARLVTLNAVEPQMQRLQRNIASLSESYDVYRKAAEDRRLMREQESRLQIQVIDPPSLPYAPNGPLPIVLVAAGALLGLASGIGLAVLLTYLRGRGELHASTMGPNTAIFAPTEAAIAPTTAIFVPAEPTFTDTTQALAPRTRVSPP
jgi:uncharacterized protein involved in exopolysaccharide biosynthesis